MERGWLAEIEKDLLTFFISKSCLSLDDLDVLVFLDNFLAFLDDFLALILAVLLLADYLFMFWPIEGFCAKDHCPQLVRTKKFALCAFRGERWVECVRERLNSVLSLIFCSEEKSTKRANG